MEKRRRSINPFREGEASDKKSRRSTEEQPDGHLTLHRQSLQKHNSMSNSFSYRRIDMLFIYMFILALFLLSYLFIGIKS